VSLTPKKRVFETESDEPNEKTSETEFKKSCPICSKNYYEAWKYKLHLAVDHNNPGSQIFKCPQCLIEFKTRTNLFQHVFRKHENERRLKCRYCYRTFCQSTRLETHVEKVHKKQANRMSNPHPDPVHSCQTCTLKFAKAWELDLHISVEHNNPSSGKFKSVSIANKSSRNIRRFVVTLKFTKTRNFSCAAIVQPSFATLQSCSDTFNRPTSRKIRLAIRWQCC